jgi:hypothetical protein
MAARRRTPPVPEPDPSLPTLGQLSLEVGDRVRFRRAAGQRWQEALVEGRERDGSVALRDEKGASRFIRFELLEVYRVRNKAGRWEAVAEQEWEQLSLFAPAAAKAKPSSRRGRKPPEPNGSVGA